MRDTVPSDPVSWRLRRQRQDEPGWVSIGILALFLGGCVWALTTTRATLPVAARGRFPAENCATETSRQRAKPPKVIVIQSPPPVQPVGAPEGEGTVHRAEKKAVIPPLVFTGNSGQPKAKPQTETPFLGPGERVDRVDPDGLLVESNGKAGSHWVGLRKIRFEDLPESVRRHYGYDAAKAVEYRTEQARAASRYALDREPVNQPFPPEAAAKVRLLTRMLAEYHKTHTYFGGDVFVCGEMAGDVWDMVETAGIRAKIMIGNVERDTTRIGDANHAWVLAEVAPERWLALEATAGRVVAPDENRRYYTGHAFANPKQLREYSSLITQLKSASARQQATVAEYNGLVERFQAGDDVLRQQLVRQLEEKKALLKQRAEDLSELGGQLDQLMSRRN